jgi:hypothetical protein
VAALEVPVSTGLNPIFVDPMKSGAFMNPVTADPYVPVAIPIPVTGRPYKSRSRGWYHFNLQGRRRDIDVDDYRTETCPRCRQGTGGQQQQTQQFRSYTHVAQLQLNEEP